MKYLLGVDIGTSSCKVTLFDFSGRPAAKSSCPYGLKKPRPGYAQQSPDDWYRGVCTALGEIFGRGFDAGEIAGVGVDGQSWSAVPVDRMGEALADTPIWMDTRAQDVCEELKETVGEETVFRVGGNPLSPTYSLPKVLWFKKHQPELYRSAYRFLQSNSYIVGRLTGQLTQDLSQSYGYASFCMEKLRFDDDLTRQLGCDPEKIPRPVPCHQVVGFVTAKAARETGLKAGTPVVAGGLDAACGALGAGAVRDGQTQEQGGQAGGLSICTEVCRTHPKLICGAHVVPDRWLLQGGTVGGGGAMAWYQRNFGCAEEMLSPDKDPFDALTEPCAAVGAGSGGVIFLPYMSGERSPIWDANAKGVFYGLHYGVEKAHVTRAVMEGCAYALRHNLETAWEAGAHPQLLTATGGAAKSRIWTQIKSDVTGLPVTVCGGGQESCLGAALLAGVGVGVYPDFETAAAETVTTERSHTPNAENKALYDKYYPIYLEIYENLKETMGRSL